MDHDHGIGIEKTESNMVNGTLACIRIAKLSKILVVDIKSDQPKFQFELNSTSVFNFSDMA